MVPKTEHFIEMFPFLFYTPLGNPLRSWIGYWVRESVQWWMFCLAWIPPKVLCGMVGIRHFVEFRTNLQLIVLKILMVVFCDEKDVV